ncbi:MAG: polysaccharide biosynthesis C-terminal domain-containing protein [Bacteroidetes bacterium]|nr:polysaccharide biosynthesis C-terminal domain-containing protein [Bacteroidota bacterium]
MGVIRRQGIKNTIIGYLGILIAFVSFFVVQPYCLTKEEIGLTRVLYSFSIIVAMFVPLGIGNATIKYFPLFKDEEKEPRLFGFMNIFPLIGYVVSAALLFTFKDFILNQYRSESPLLLEYFDFVFPLIFFNAFIAILSVYCNANYKSTIPSFLNDVGVRLAMIGIVGIYFLKIISLDQFIAAYIGIFGLQLVLLLVYIFYFDKPSFKVDWPSFREKKMFELIRYGLLLWFASVASIGIKNLDVIMLPKYLTLDLVGIYAIAAFIPTVIEAPINALDRIAAPKISFAWNVNDKSQIQEIYHKSSLYLFLFGGFFLINILTNIHTVLQFLPDGFQRGEPVVIIFSIGALINMATGVNGSILNTSEKFRYGAFYYILLAILLIGFQVVFIPVFGMIGAALATTSAQIIYNLLVFLTVYKFFKLQPFNIKNLYVLIIIICTCTLSYLLPHFENKFFDIGVRTAVVSLIYFLAVYRMNIVSEFHKHLPWKNEK